MLQYIYTNYCSCFNYLFFYNNLYWSNMLLEKQNKKKEQIINQNHELETLIPNNIKHITVNENKIEKNLDILITVFDDFEIIEYPKK
jgi:hypothetical protein